MIKMHGEKRPNGNGKCFVFSTSVDPLFCIMFYQPKYLATKNHGQGTKVKGDKAC